MREKNILKSQVFPFVFILFSASDFLQWSMQQSKAIENCLNEAFLGTVRITVPQGTYYARAGIHNIQTAGQMWAAEAYNLSR